MRLSSLLGFDTLYESYFMNRHTPELYQTELIRGATEVMYALGVLDANGVFKGVKTRRGILTRVKKFRSELEAEIKEKVEQR